MEIDGGRWRWMETEGDRKGHPCIVLGDGGRSTHCPGVVRAKCVQRVLVRHDERLGPVVIIEWHVLDEPHINVAIARQLRKSIQLLYVSCFARFTAPGCTGDF